MKIARLIVTALLAALALSAPALAGDIVVTVGLKSGQLSVKAPGAAAAPGKTIEIPITVADARGTGAGWTLKLNAGKSVTVTGITARCAAGSTCTLPKAAALAKGPSILRVARNTGMGVIQLVVTVAPLAQGSASVPLDFSVV